MIEALLADEIDIGPLDSYALDLMLRHQPDLAARSRIVATSDACANSVSGRQPGLSR